LPPSIDSFSQIIPYAYTPEEFKSEAEYSEQSKEFLDVMR